MESIEARFRQFLTEVSRLRPRFVDNSDRLGAFLVQAKRFVVEPTRLQWQRLKPQLDTLSPWYTNCDLLDSIVSLEDSYTELIAWALRPGVHPESAQLRQRNWVASLGIDWANDDPAEPCTQMWTNDGIPDLVLQFRTQTIVIEVKTHSQEHSTPYGKYQTVAYPDAVRATLRLGPEHPVHIVFLTPDSRPAENADAICTSFARFAVVLAKTLADIDLPDNFRVLVGMVITLLSTLGSPIKNMVGWRTDIDDALLIQHIGDISLVTRLLAGITNV